MKYNGTESPRGRGARRREAAVGAVLIACALILGSWEVMALRSRRPFNRFTVTPARFQGFMAAGFGSDAGAGRTGKWIVKPLPVTQSAQELNVLALEIGPAESARARSGIWPVFLRLVHGYNMRDCMRIKGYEVDLIRDSDGESAGDAGRQAHGRRQAWRLRCGTGVSVWVTSVVRAGDLRGTDRVVTSFAFPRVDIPDEQGWSPDGITLQSLRHPVTNFRKFLRAKWNGSRCDVLTFLGLRQPAWAEDELLTMVAASGEAPAGLDEAAAARAVLEAHDFVHAELMKWAGEGDREISRR